MLRQCLREPIPEIEIAARRLNEAVSAPLRGERAIAEELLHLANDNVVRQWLYSVWGKATIYNQPRRVVDHSPPIRIGERAKPRDATNETKRLIHRRDGYYCRFCKIPVIRSKVRAALRKEYPRAVPWERTNDAQHAGFQCMWAQYGHIVPHARGGQSDLENVYLTCAACNYGSGDNLLEELDLLHPRLHAPRQGDWDGLERLASNNGSNVHLTTGRMAATGSM